MVLTDIFISALATAEAVAVAEANQVAVGVINKNIKRDALSESPKQATIEGPDQAPETRPDRELLAEGFEFLLLSCDNPAVRVVLA